MQTAELFFMDNRASAARRNLDRLQRLVRRAGLADVVSKGDLVCIKLSFSELGNLGYIHPAYVRTVVEAVKKVGGRPCSWTRTPYMPAAAPMLTTRC